MKNEKMKKVSKIISFITKINMILLIPAMGFVSIALLVTPFIISNVEVKDNKILFYDNEYTYKVESGSITIDDQVIDLKEEKMSERILSMFKAENKMRTTVVSEILIMLALATLALIYQVFKNINKLFKNIANEETPFTENNIKYITNSTKYMIIIMFLSIFANLIIWTLTGMEAKIDISLMEILAILIAYSLSLVFEYGYSLQKEIDTTL